MSNNTLANGFSDLAVPIVDGGTNDANTMSLTFNGEDQGAKGTITPVGADGAITAWVKVNDASRDETFRLRPRVSGYKALSAAITIDGVTVQPSIRLEAGDATASAWTDVVNSTSFAIAGTGADPTFDELSPGIDCKRVKFNAGKRYEASASSVGAVGTDDIVAEFIVAGTASGVHYAINKRGAAGDGEAIIFYISSSTLLAYIAGSSVSASVVLAALVPGATYHVMVFLDRSGNMRGYVNSVAGAAVSIAPLSAVNLASAAKWNLGSDNGGGSAFPGSLSYFALWTRASWLTTADQAGIAAERFARCCGVYAETAQTVNPAGTELDGAIPSAQSRTTIANLEKWNIANTEAYLIPVGPNWIRTDKIKTQDGSFKIGARIENGQTNRLLYSEDFSQANWTKTRVTLGTPVVALGSLSFDAIIASADNDTHRVSQAVTTAASEHHAVSFYAKRGGANSIKIELAEDTTQYAYYNLEFGTIGAVGAGFALSQPAHIYDMGNGYYRCEFRPTTAGITGTIRVYTSNGSTVGAETFAGNGSTTSCWLSGAQFERYVSATQQSGSLTSYVKTTTAAVSRVKDTLTYHGYENCGGKDSKNTAARIDYVCPVFVSGYTGFRNFGAITAKAANDRTELYRADSTNKAVALVNVGGASQALLSSVTAPIFDGQERAVEACFAKNNISIVLSHAVDVTDTSANLPELKEIVVGASTAYASQLDGLITNFLLSPYGAVYPRAIFALDKDAYTQSAFVGYDALDENALTYELRAGAGTSRLPTLNGGALNAGTWYLISLEWVSGTGITLKIDGVGVDSAVADATIAELTDLFIAWAGLYGYIYEPTAGDPDYPITYGAISIADVQHHTANLPAAWYTEMVARGVPAKNEHLIHQISQVAQQGADHYDLLTGAPGAITEVGMSRYVPPTEVGLALGASAVNKTIVDFGTGFAFMAATSHSYDAWIRVDGSGDQCVWANGDENSTDSQALLYDDATDSLVYTCAIGATARQVSAAIELDRLYHVAVTRDYDSGAGTTAITIYLDSVAVESQTYTGAPVVTNDAFVMLSTSEAAGVFTLPFIGATVGNRFYNAALTLAEVETIYAADSAIMLNGPYATQVITAAALPATISGAIKPSAGGEGLVEGHPIVLVQEAAGGEWRAIASAQSSSGWSTFSKATPLNAIRLYAKSYDTYGQASSNFDDLDGGEDPGDYAIAPVEVAKNKRKALENIVLMRKPLHSWAVMVVRYT